jgi:hypothetical protein
MSLSGEYRWLNQLPPLVGQSVVGGATRASRLKAGAGRCDCALAVVAPTLTAADASQTAATPSARALLPIELIVLSPKT